MDNPEYNKANEAFQAEVLQNPDPKRAASWAKTPESERAEAAFRAHFGDDKIRLERNLPNLPPEGTTDPRVLGQYEAMGYGWYCRVLDHENPALTKRIKESEARALAVRDRSRERAASPAYKANMPAQELAKIIREDDEYAEMLRWSESVSVYGGHEHIFRQLMLIKWPGHPLRDLALELWGALKTDESGTLTLNPLRPGHQKPDAEPEGYDYWTVEEPDVYAEPLFFEDFTRIVAEGFIVPIGGQNYRIVMANVDLETWYEDPSEIEVTFTPTDEPVQEQAEPYIGYGKNKFAPTSGIQFFGVGRFQQDARGTRYKGQMCFTLFTGDPGDHDQTWTMMFNTDDKGKPCQLWLEISST